jgi:hypothetical protein
VRLGAIGSVYKADLNFEDVNKGQVFQNNVWHSSLDLQVVEMEESKLWLSIATGQDHALCTCRLYIYMMIMTVLMRKGYKTSYIKEILCHY